MLGQHKTMVISILSTSQLKLSRHLQHKSLPARPILRCATTYVVQLVAKPNYCWPLALSMIYLYLTFMCRRDSWWWNYWKCWINDFYEISKRTRTILFGFVDIQSLARTGPASVKSAPGLIHLHLLSARNLVSDWLQPVAIFVNAWGDMSSGVLC